MRAGVASAIAVLAASTAHTLSGGSAPPAWLMLAVALLAWPIALVLIGRGPSLPRTAATISAAQVLLHGAFAVVGTAAPTGGTGLAHAGHVHGVMALPGLMTGGVPLDAAMIAGHVVAAAVTTLLVTYGERLLRALADGVRRALPALPGPVLAPVAAPASVGWTVPALPSRVTLSGLSRRGPPR